MRRGAERTGEEREVRHVVLVVIDGLPLDFVIPEVDSSMPHYSELANIGYLGVLSSTIPPETGPAMGSILTGANPGKHGIFSMYVPEVDPRRKQISVKPSFYGKIQCPTMVEISNTLELRLGLFAIPLLWPIPKISNGFAVPGFATPGDALAYPSWAEAVVSKKSNVLRLDPTYFTLDPEDQAEKLSYNIEQKAEILLTLLGEMKDPPDILVSWISETDFAGHRFFDQPRLYAQVLSAADRFVARLGEIFDFRRDSLLLVTGDHGMTQTSMNLYPNVPLIRAGYLRLKNHPITLLRRLASIPIDWLHDRSRKAAMMAAKLSASKESLSYRLLSKLVLSLRDIDPLASVLFSVGGFNPYTPIYILGDRGEETAKKMIKMSKKEVIENLREAFVDTGLQDILLSEEVYSGPMVREAPLAILKHGEGTANWTKIPSNMKPVTPPGATPRGVHDLFTPLLATGPMVIPKKEPGNPTGSLVDLLPTILFALQKPVFDFMDGRPLLSIFRTEFSRRPVEVIQSTKVYLTRKLRMKMRASLKGRQGR